jgi:hypothetical protein
MHGAIALGYPDSQPATQPRKPLAKTVTWFEEDLP